MKTYLREAFGFQEKFRVLGASKTMTQRKRPLKQAPSLPADWLYKLEELMKNLNYDLKCILGFLLFCSFSSARFSDAARSTSIEVDKYEHILILETSTHEFKTKPGKEQSKVALPMLALGHGLSSTTSWGMEWVQARQRAHLPPGSIMPAYSEVAQSWLDRRMTASEGSLWLREFLCLSGMDSARADQYSSHTMKVTLLEWAATSGVLNYDERRVMGHHFDSRLAMPLIYSRDALAQIQMKIFRLLEAIRQGVFDPNASRARRIADETKPETYEDVEHSDSADNSEGSRGNIDHVDLGLGVANEGEPLKDRPTLPASLVETALIHRHSGVVHFTNDGITLGCGRVASANFVKMDFSKIAVEDQIFCRQCSHSLESS